MITKEAIEQLQTSAAKIEQIEVDGLKYIATPNHMVLKKIAPMTPDPLRVSSLQGVVEYLRQAGPASIIGVGETDGRLMVHIPSYNEVRIISGLNSVHQNRRCYVTAEVPDNCFNFNRFMPVEEFIISAMANFVAALQFKEVLTFVSSLQADEQDKTEDDGISQRVLVKKSVTTVGSAVVPNPVELQPYVTFPDISQPTQTYIFRVRKEKGQPIACALFRVAARTWEVTTVYEIRNYFQTHAPDVIVIS